MFAKKVKNPKTGRTRTVSYGQAGKAKDGGKRIRPGTSKGDSYCARSAGQMKKHPKAAKAPGVLPLLFHVRADNLFTKMNVLRIC